MVYTHCEWSEGDARDARELEVEGVEGGTLVLQVCEATSKSFQIYTRIRTGTTGTSHDSFLLFLATLAPSRPHHLRPLCACSGEHRVAVLFSVLSDVEFDGDYSVMMMVIRTSTKPLSIFSHEQVQGEAAPRRGHLQIVSTMANKVQDGKLSMACCRQCLHASCFFFLLLARLTDV